MDDVEKHRKKYEHNDEVLCLQLLRNAASLVLPNFMAIKSHTARVHKTSLRRSKSFYKDLILIHD